MMKILLKKGKIHSPIALDVVVVLIIVVVVFLLLLLLMTMLLLYDISFIDSACGPSMADFL